jgi:hypothetical protein
MEVKDQSGATRSNGEPFPAAPTDEGTFEVPGPEGRGIPPGKYRISVVLNPRNSVTAPRPKSQRDAANRDHDFLGGRFGPASSPIVRTLDAPTHVVIDLDRPTG